MLSEVLSCNCPVKGYKSLIVHKKQSYSKRFSKNMSEFRVSVRNVSSLWFGKFEDASSQCTQWLIDLLCLFSFISKWTKKGEGLLLMWCLLLQFWRLVHFLQDPPDSIYPFKMLLTNQKVIIASLTKPSTPFCCSVNMNNLQRFISHSTSVEEEEDYVWDLEDCSFILVVETALDFSPISNCWNISCSLFTSYNWLSVNGYG